ncbi:hypothetical protein RINTHM_14890 [Richelia intracellularis HM01]|nr:hypothetical protein RINTHM_14890 [Richelia intracellularis HM01]
MDIIKQNPENTARSLRQKKYCMSVSINLLTANINKAF